MAFQNNYIIHITHTHTKRKILLMGSKFNLAVAESFPQNGVLTHFTILIIENDLCASVTKLDHLLAPSVGRLVG